MSDYVDRKLQARKKAREKGMMYRKYIRSSGDGLEIALAPAFGVLLGYFAQERYDVAPWGIAFGLFIGVGLSVRTAYRLIQNQKSHEDEEEQRVEPLMRGNTKGAQPMLDRFHQKNK